MSRQRSGEKQADFSLVAFFCREFLTHSGPDVNGSLMVSGFYVGTKVAAWLFGCK